MKNVLTLALLLLCGSLWAQDTKNNWVKVERDSIPAHLLEEIETDYSKVQVQPTNEWQRVITNRFWHNWYVYVDAGIHSFRGDWSGNDKFSGTLSPNFNAGIGKWFTPGFGIKALFGMGTSRGYSEKVTAYTYGDPIVPTDGGNPYYKMKTRWWDMSANATFNLSRILFGWEGYGSEKRFNQFILTLGIGAVHHYDKTLENTENDLPYYGPMNEWFGNVELQYSRFLHKNKAWSIDFKLRGRFYETHFDMSPFAGRRWDYNVGASIGLTYYIKNRGWERCIPCAGGPNYYFTAPVPTPATEAPENCFEQRSFTFYVFYPNNYSGRDDAPIVANANVNSMDYLAGGIFAQQRFSDKNSVEARLRSNGQIQGLSTENIPTEKATFTENPSGVTRGYEISKNPISLSMDATNLTSFAENTGYFYAPIYGPNKTWYYRIDKDTRTQTLSSEDNYKENVSYALNAHAGLNTIKQHLPVSTGTDLYSFADVYAALEGNTGYISQHADAKTVAEIEKILKYGKILHVQSEGVATSQDNKTDDVDGKIGLERNQTLSHNRALSVIQWLQGNKKLSHIEKEKFSLNILPASIEKVDDKSTQGLNAKLNRRARITVTYLIAK